MIRIDDKALLYNASYFDDKITNAKLCAVLKCDAYGHGLTTCATLLADSVDYYALSSIAEADSICHVGVPIIILHPLDAQDTARAVERGYAITVDSVATALRVAEYGCDATVHIKVDSGMCRLGVDTNGLVAVLDILMHADVIVEGIYSHCAHSADMQYTDVQLSYFLHCCRIAQCMLGYMPIRHFANTESTMLHDRYHLDMVRIGLGLYGYGASNLKPVKSVLGRVLAVKNVVKGSIVGYDNTYIVPADTSLAIVDIGYWHGITNNIRAVSIANIAMKVVAKVCMSMIIVDIGTNTVKEFDEVTIIGNNIGIPYDNNISVYELLCATKDITR